jgi:hypothetical protein
MMPRNLRFLALVSFLAACQTLSAPETPTSSPTASPAPLPTSTWTPEPSPVPPTSSPTPSPLPPQRSFAEEFNEPPPYWRYQQVDTGNPLPTPKVDAGFLVFDLPSPNQWVYGIYDPFGYSDVMLDVSVQVRSGSHAAPGLVCRYDAQRGWYEFDVLDDQTYVLLYGQWLADGVARYTPLVQAGSDKIQAGQNELGLLCQGDVLTPFINGTQLRRRQESTYGLAEGKVGIAAASFDHAPAEIAFDWVKVSIP